MNRLSQMNALVVKPLELAATGIGELGVHCNLHMSSVWEPLRARLQEFVADPQPFLDGTRTFFTGWIAELHMMIAHAR